MPSTSSLSIYGFICILSHHGGCLNCVYQVTSNLRSFKFNEYFSFLIINDSMRYGLSLAFLTTPMCLLIIFCLLCWLIFVYLFLMSAFLTPPISLFLVSLVTLTAHMASAPYWRVLTHLLVLISKPRSTCSNWTLYPFLYPFNFSVSCLREWYHQPSSYQSQNLRSHFLFFLVQGLIQLVIKNYFTFP